VKATLAGHVVAESDEVVEHDGYCYFPRRAVRMEWLAPAAKTASDRACPHGVQFYDVAVDGVRYARVAWSYEAPRAALRHVDHLVGFWEEVEVA
jgi:uncharacterized protein (DUF427 family)